MLAFSSSFRSSKQKLNDCYRTDERGAFIPIVAIMLSTIFLLIGLAIDGGNLYWKHILTQKAVDAAAATAAKFIAVTPKNVQLANQSGFLAQVKTLAEKVVEANLPGTDPANLSVAIVNNGAITAEHIEVSARLKVPLLFMSIFPEYDKLQLVSAAAEAEVEPAMVSFLIDSSASMILPDDGTPCADPPECTCRPTCTGSYPPPIARRWNVILSALPNFLQQFNQTRDKFYVNNFSLAANQIPATIMEATGNIFEDVNDELNRLGTQGNTNPCDALLRAYVETQQAAVNMGRITWGRDRMAYILLTDGPPTAGRFFFTATTGLPPNSFPLLSSAPNDYYSWLAEGTGGTSFTYSQLTPAKIKYNYTDDGAPSRNRSDADHNGNLGGNDCVGLPSSFCQSPPACSSISNPNDGCLGNLSFQTPDGKVWPDPFPGSSANTTDKMVKAYYNCVIAMADTIRNDGGVVYAIGIGPPAPAGGDPYQNVLEYEDRKDYFLARVANDDSAYEPGVPRFPSPYDKFTQSGNVPPIPEWFSKGTYFGASNAQGLNTILNNIRDLILRRLKTVKLTK